MHALGDTTLVDLPEPRSVEDIAAIALAVEKEAEHRYSAYARDLRALGSPKLVALLEELGGEHGARAGRRETDMSNGEPRELDSKELSSLLSQLFSEDATAAGDLFGPTLYGVLAFAVRLAQQTFKLYSYFAATADQGGRDYAERLANEELSRAAGLRVARRRAFHAGRRHPKPVIYPVASLVESQADLLAAALAIEDRLAQRLATAREQDTGLSSTCNATCQWAEALRRAAEQAGAPSSPMAEVLAEFSQSAQRNAQAGQDLTTLRQNILANCERAFTFYDAVASAPINEATMLQAQDLSQAAVERIRQVLAVVDKPDETVRAVDDQ